jgi:diguanylate cyclase (GGDEF)-like protein/PAS domain S-box-containing protein
MPTERTIPWYRSIRFKLIVTAVLVEAIMLTLLLANSYRLVSEALESQTNARLAALAPLLNASLAGRVFQRDHSEINAILQQLVGSKLTEISYIVVFDRQNAAMASAGNLTPELLANTAPVDQSLTSALSKLTYDTEVPLTIQNNTVGRARFGLSIVEMVSLRGNVLQQSLWIALGEILLSLLLLASGGYLITRHIATLLEATRRIASADYSTPIAIASRDEIGVLADNFNRMAANVQSRIEQLAESESRFRTIFDAAADAFFIHDATDGRLLDVNQRMCEMYGCTRAQALCATHAEFSANIEPYTMVEAAEKLRLAREEGPQTFDWLARRLDGQQFWVEVNLRMTKIGNAERIIALVHDISERKRYQHELEFIAHHDPLTQLPNRVLLTDRLNQAIAQIQRSNRLLSIAYLDLDGFKAVNDRYGHETGDRLLMMVAQRLKDSMRAGDTACRLGGDEFALLLGDQASVDASMQAIQRLLDTIAAPYFIDQRAIQISASIGITHYPLDNADTDTLMRHADQAMYVAKQSGRNRLHLFDAEHDRLAQAHHSARERIEAALPQQEFVLYYQPKVDMAKGTVIGAEALIRWQHPERGLVAPGDFLPIVEDSEFSIPLGEWVISTALAQLATWHAAGLQLAVSVNISARHLQSPNFSARLAALLADYPEVTPSALELEVVESVALEDMVRVSQVIDACHEIGVSFALDDFGTGYSSLSYFKRLRVDVLKIDQSFVRDLLTDDEDRAIVEGVISLTRTFKRQVIAEGVENAATGRALLDMGCSSAQGYGIARPMPAAALPGWIAGWQPDPLWQS